MKHGRTLLMALEELARTANGDARATGRAATAEHIAPLRPGAFAAWAARRMRDAEPRVDGARPPVARPLRQGPPVI